MTTKQFRTSVATICRGVLSRNQLRYQDVQINYGMSYLSIGDYFAAQGEHAQDLIDKAEETAEKTGLNVKTCLVWYLESAGVI